MRTTVRWRREWGAMLAPRWIAEIGLAFFRVEKELGSGEWWALVDGRMVGSESSKRPTQLVFADGVGYALR